MSQKFSSSFIRELTLDRDSIESFDPYPFSVPAVRNLSTLHFHPKVTYIIGENGLGKSTLIESIAVQLGLNPEGGTRNFGFETRASHTELYKHLNLARGSKHPRDAFFLRAESFFTFATEIEKRDRDPESGGRIIEYYGGRSLHEQSHGESFFALFRHRFGGGGIYILDEPEAALSPMRQLAFLGIIHELIGRGSQFIIATHSPIIMAYPDAAIHEITEAAIGERAYEDTEHYQITRGFLENRERTLRELFGDADRV